MTRSGKVQPVKCFSRSIYSSIEPDRSFGNTDIIIDRFWDGDKINSAFGGNLS
jgi:hypothetical protein